MAFLCQLPGLRLSNRMVGVALRGVRFTRASSFLPFETIWQQQLQRSRCSAFFKNFSHCREERTLEDNSGSLHNFWWNSRQPRPLWGSPLPMDPGTQSREDATRRNADPKRRRGRDVPSYNTTELNALKVSQLKRVLDMGAVDYRDCLERKELVERLLETQDFIPPAAQTLLQQYIEGIEPSIDSLSTDHRSSAARTEEGWWLEAERNAIKVFQDAGPSVLNITTVRWAKDMAMNAMEIPRGTGSAFVWDKDGHVVTNYHVVMSGERARVTLADATTWDAEVVGVAKNKDIAVVKIDAPSSKLKPICVGTSQGLQVGQHVLAIGNPFGLDRTLTSGIISGVGRDIRGIGGRIIRGVIQTDASINPGNSGGPLLDSQGRLIGVNTAIYSPSGASAGVGFAIPVDTVRRVVNEIIRDGKAVRPGLGIICASDSQAKQLGVMGVLVLDLSPNGAAASAGLRGTSRDDFGRIVLGDVIVGINGQTLSTVEDLLAAFDDRDVGETVRVTIKRGNSIRDYYITLSEIDEQ